MNKLRESATLIYVSATLVIVSVYSIYFHGWVVAALHGHWTTSGELEAGYLLLALSVYLISTNLNRWREQGGRSAHFGSTNRMQLVISIGVLLLAIFAVLSDWAANKSLAILLLFGLWAAGLILVFGIRTWQSVFWPVLTVVIMTPMIYFFTPALQNMSVIAVNGVLNYAPFSVFVEENYIYLANGTLAIEEGCSGLKFFQTSIILAVVEAQMSGRSFQRTIIQVSIFACIGIICNWIRISVIVFIAEQLGVSHDWVQDHNWIGWLVFAIVFAPIIYLTKPAGQSIEANLDKLTLVSATRGIGLFVVTLVIAGVSVLMMAEQRLGLATTSNPNLVAVTDFYCTEDLTNAGQLERPNFWPEFVDPDYQSYCHSTSVGEQTNASIVSYAEEEQGREIIQASNLIAGAGAEKQFDHPIHLDSLSDSPGKMGVYKGSDGTRVQTITVYRIAGYWTASEARYKLIAMFTPFRESASLALILQRPCRASQCADFTNISSTFERLHKAIGREAGDLP